MMIRSAALTNRLPQTVKDEIAVTRFLFAAALRQFSAIRYFVEDVGLHPDTTANGKPTALCYAVLQKDRCMMQYLIVHGADVNKVDQMGLAPIHYASLGGCCYCLSYLLYSGAEINKASLSGKTPLSLSAGRADLSECAELLKRHGAGISGEVKKDDCFH